MERSEGMVELMELLKNEMEVRLGRRQRREGKGPARLVLERSREETELEPASQVTPGHLQGVSSRSFQAESAASGSSRECLRLWRYRPSWLRERVAGGTERRKRRKRKSIVVVVGCGEEVGFTKRFGVNICGRDRETRE